FTTMKLLLISALLLVLSTLTADGAAVFDISGNALKPGTPYYITSAIWGAGGGGLFPLMRPRICPRCRFCCPLNVAQKSSDLDKGHPVIMSPSDSSEEVVHLLTDVKIEFTGHVPDGGSPIWKLDRADSNGHRYVTLNGDPNNSIDANNWFKIDKMGRIGYKLLYCPSVAGTVADGPCGSLGISFEDGNRWLVLSDQPFGVVFVMA
ncbi:Kunitz-type protease inhibitor, partial [Salmonella enterica]|uniref:Kunitz-type protease inhibitor n=1 Tax=Salmonella enterica TaxID=28901 RepID=UPI002895A294